MIVCSCNVLTDGDIFRVLGDRDGALPRTPAQAYKCLGCAPRCGRCLPLIRSIMEKARGQDAACSVGCVDCPGRSVR
jgi:NAD(P)H-nitrite reductase